MKNLLCRKLASAKIRLCWFLFRRRLAVSSAVAKVIVRLAYPEIDGVIKSFTSGGGKVGNWQYLRALSLVRLLAKHRPSSITELGSGASTGVFLRYSQDEKAKFVSFEESESWADVTRRGLKLISQQDPILMSDVERAETGVRHIDPIPPDSDFVYIDGPYSRISGVVRPNTDIIEAFKRGHRPKVIVVDARIPTVELIQKFSGGADYSFTPSTRAAAANASLLGIIRSAYHSVFVLQAGDRAA